MKLISLRGLLASSCLAIAAAGCSGADSTLAQDDGTLAVEFGSARLNLQVGDRNISSVTAVISGKHGFETQTHAIDVSGTGVISIFFGNLPVGHGYKIQLTAGDCSGSSVFRVDAGQTTLVPVTLTCGGGGSDDPKETGSAQITGTIVGGDPSTSCDHITKIVAAPSVQNGSGPNPAVEVVLNEGVSATGIVWSASSPNGGSGSIGALSGATDREVSFDCATDGSVQLVADVTALEGTTSCTEQARVTIECLNQGGSGPVCGNGVVEGSEQCDGTAGVGSCPAGTSGTVTCTAQCTRNTSACVAAPTCGNGIVEGSEQCDGTAGVGSCPAGTSGTVTCTAQCTRNTSACTSTPPLGECGACAAENCGLQRAEVDANIAAVDPIIACVLGDNWEAGQRAAATSCANGDLLTCYCGSLAGQDCANAAPASLDGQCVSEVLAGTSCTSSSCVAPIFLNPANANGKAMQYIQCQQDFCFDSCFN